MVTLRTFFLFPRSCSSGRSTTTRMVSSSLRVWHQHHQYQDQNDHSCTYATWVTSSLCPPSIRNNGDSKVKSMIPSQSFGTNRNGKDFYMEEMKELEQERIQLFGDEDPFESHHSNRNLMELRNEERDLIYNFTPEEKSAWTTMTKTKLKEEHEHYESTLDDDEDTTSTSSSSLTSLKQVIAAREAYYESMEHHSSSISSSSGISSTSHHPLTHVNPRGDEISMVDVGNKVPTKRLAQARSSIYLPPEVVHALHVWNPNTNTTEIMGTKGPIFHTARVAGIMAAKRTSDLIPLCHPLPLNHIQIDIQWSRRIKTHFSIPNQKQQQQHDPKEEEYENVIVIECTCSTTHTTGVEMEALMGANVAALTIYDMLKAVSHRIRIERTELVWKRGGKRDVGMMEQNDRVSE